MPESGSTPLFTRSGLNDRKVSGNTQMTMPQEGMVLAEREANDICQESAALNPVPWHESAALNPDPWQESATLNPGPWQESATLNPDPWQESATLNPDP